MLPVAVVLKVSVFDENSALRLVVVQFNFVPYVHLVRVGAPLSSFEVSFWIGWHLFAVGRGLSILQTVGKWSLCPVSRICAQKHFMAMFSETMHRSNIDFIWQGL